MQLHVFSEVSLLIVISAVIALFMRLLRQPLLIGYIFTGILVGPGLLNLAGEAELLRVMGEFGIALLLFIVGLGLNPKEIKEVGRVALLTGLGQVIFTSTIGFAIARMLGYEPTEAFYISVALTFSSTIIILKLLTDKREQNQLYGKISIGFLLVQDIVAAIALIVASAMGREGGLNLEGILELLYKGLAIFTGVFVFANVVIKRMTNFLSKSQELLFLFALAWGFGVGAVSLETGFSLEVGALLAGVALASMPYAQEIGSRLRPLRDFFIVVFFIALGSSLNFGSLGPLLPQAFLFSVFVLVGNPIIVMAIMGILGYTKRTGFKAGLTVAQISEFSIIFVLLGLRNGQLTEEVVSLVTFVGIVTIALSSYMIIYADKLYTIFSDHLSIFERKRTKNETIRHHNYDAVLFGYKRGGLEFIKAFRKTVKKYIVIDYDPEAIDIMERRNIPYLYGDATDVELLEEAGLDKAKLIVSNVTDHETNAGLLHTLSRVNKDAVVICHAEDAEEADRLYGLGASYVTVPHVIGNEEISKLIKRSGLKKAEFKKAREKHLEKIQHHLQQDSKEE
jgi:Kef-type K+ transport system membrane component KefB